MRKVVGPQHMTEDRMDHRLLFDLQSTKLKWAGRLVNKKGPDING